MQIFFQCFIKKIQFSLDLLNQYFMLKINLEFGKLQEAINNEPGKSYEE